jgi:hypothetical protein
MSEAATSSPALDAYHSLLRVLEKRELLSHVLAFVGEGTEVAAMLLCKDLCKFVRLLRGWQEEKEGEKEKMIVSCMSVSRVSSFLLSTGLIEWGVDVLGMPMTGRTTELAVRGGHVCTLAWLLSRGVPLERKCWSEWGDKKTKLRFHGACCWAAEAGHLSVL